MSDSADLSGYSGQARLFPLPNLVFFPNVMQPLHIFEPRYRQMTADALAGDRFIAMVLPRPGWEKDYAGKPAIHRVACLGRVLAEQTLEDGRFNILLRGQVQAGRRRNFDHVVGERRVGTEAAALPPCEREAGHDEHDAGHAALRDAQRSEQRRAGQQQQEQRTARVIRRRPGPQREVEQDAGAARQREQGEDEPDERDVHAEGLRDSRADPGEGTPVSTRRK